VGWAKGKRKREEMLLTEHVPQAFSHFSYQYSEGSMLVCDLQGVYNDLNRCREGKVHPAVFELTDPVIHHAAENERVAPDKRVYGRTDKGNKGIQDFFRTHTCNAACRLLGLKEHVLPSVRSKGHKEDNPDVPTSNKKSSICKKSDKNNARKQFTVFCNETRPKIVQEHPEYTLEQITKSLRIAYDQLDVVQKTKYAQKSLKAKPVPKSKKSKKKGGVKGLNITAKRPDKIQRLLAKKVAKAEKKCKH